MTWHNVRLIAATAGAAAAVTAFAAGCGAAAVTADSDSAIPQTAGASTPATAPSEVSLVPPADVGGPEPTTETQEAPGPQGPTDTHTGGNEAVPPVVETPAPPTGGGKGGH